MNFKLKTLIGLLALCALQPSVNAKGVIPAPREMSVVDDATTSLPGKLTYSINGVDSAVENTRLKGALEKMLGSRVESVKQVKKNGFIVLQLDPSVNSGDEGYVADINAKNIVVKARTAAGLFYGLQTLRAMLDDAPALPQGQIIDEPRFAYRGMMLDVSRNFRDKDFVKKQIDAMARLKLNNLHLHLTDGAGWRLQIDRYPELTDFAAWRKGKTWKDWNDNGNLYLRHDDPEAQGGFYTKDDIREILAYAADNYINVIPEIEMPSHSEEVLTAYPELSCTHEPYKESDFCPGNEKSYEFIENVLDEVMELFPSKLIHIGGDEAPKKSWGSCELCKKRMAEEGIENVDGLQSYMIHRVERYLNSKGRDMLGWDEIMEGGLAPNATVMSWRGTEGGEKAAAAGHRVVMTPGRYCYLDGYQDAPYSQPEAIGGYLPLSLAFSYDPVPESLKGTDREKFIYGLQGNLFTEYVPTDAHAEYMLYPRMFAIAERGWSNAPDNDDYAAFRENAVVLADRMRAEGYNVFDIANEIGNRKEAQAPLDHLAKGKKVAYNIQPWKNYPANGELTLTDGLRGGWNYNDARWQAFLGRKSGAMDVVVDLEKPTDVKFVGADFMQICGPGVFMPAKVTISFSDDGENFTEAAVVDHKVVRDNVVSFKNFSWSGDATTRYVRYSAEVDPEIGGILFVDEIVVQ